MKRDYLRFSSQFILLFAIFAAHAPVTGLNVGTTLFSESDLYKQCWSSENIAILTSRMILEDLLPTKDCLVIENSEFINDIIQYFRLILEVIRRETYGKTKHITLMALTDLLGGYLNHAVLPVAKHSYYAGFIDFVSIERLVQLFDELKWFLRTNGQGWAAPIRQDPYRLSADPVAVQPPTAGMQPCNGLVTFDNVHAEMGAAPVAAGEIRGCKTAFVVPLPFFDSKYSPSAIAVPFRAYPLRNIESQCAAYVVLKYYIAGHKCIQSKRQQETDSIKIFNNNLYTWIVHEVVPKMDDEKFYSAFGGVMRVVASLKKAGATEVDLGKAMHSMSELTGNKSNTIDEMPPSSTKPSSEHLSKKSILIMALLIAIGIWFMIGTIFICYRIRTKGEAKSRSSRPSSTDSATPTTGTKSSCKFPFPRKKDRTPSPKTKKVQDSQTTEGFEQVDLSDGTSPYNQDQVTGYACHSSLTGDYATEEKRGGPYVFAYDDFETSSDESTSRATDTEIKSGVSK